MMRIKLAPSSGDSVGLSIDGPELCCGCLAERPGLFVTLEQGVVLTHQNTETHYSTSLSLPVCPRCMSLFADRDWRTGMTAGIVFLAGAVVTAFFYNLGWPGKAAFGIATGLLGFIGLLAFVRGIARRSHGWSALGCDPASKPVPASLEFDRNWNRWVLCLENERFADRFLEANPHIRALQ